MHILRKAYVVQTQNSVSLSLGYPESLKGHRCLVEIYKMSRNEASRSFVDYLSSNSCAFNVSSYRKSTFWFKRDVKNTTII